MGADTNNELYLPSVFEHTALTNLTPMITEEQGRGYVFEGFRSFGVNVNQPADLQSLGLITAVDDYLIPYQTWTFQVERNGRWGQEVAGVDVDVTDGHIVWSHTFMEK
jgi:hypothetical protein